jgi:hypothetical protein
MTKTRTVSLVVLFLLLCVPGIAHAERHPTPREKAAIEMAAHEAYADQLFGISAETAVWIVLGVIVLILLLVLGARTKDPEDEIWILRIRRPPR